MFGKLMHRNTHQTRVTRGLGNLALLGAGFQLIHDEHNLFVALQLVGFPCLRVTHDRHELPSIFQGHQKFFQGRDLNRHIGPLLTN